MATGRLSLERASRCSCPWGHRPRRTRWEVSAGSPPLGAPPGRPRGMVRPAGRARLPRLGLSARAGAPRAGSGPDSQHRAGAARAAPLGTGPRGPGRGPPRSLPAAATMSDQAPKVPEEMFREVKYYAVGDIDPQVQYRLCRRVPGPSPLASRARARARASGPHGRVPAGPAGLAALKPGRLAPSRPAAGGRRRGSGPAGGGSRGTFGRGEGTSGGGPWDPRERREGAAGPAGVEGGDLRRGVCGTLVCAQAGEDGRARGWGVSALAPRARRPPRALAWASRCLSPSSAGGSWRPVAWP